VCSLHVFRVYKPHMKNSCAHAFAQQCLCSTPSPGINDAPSKCVFPPCFSFAQATNGKLLCKCIRAAVSLIDMTPSPGDYDAPSSCVLSPCFPYLQATHERLLCTFVRPAVSLIPRARPPLTNVTGQWLQCQANGSNVRCQANGSNVMTLSPGDPRCARARARLLFEVWGLGFGVWGLGFRV